MMDLNPDIVAALHSINDSIRFFLGIIFVALLWRGKR